jgi:hypothetical protein
MELVAEPVDNVIDSVGHELLSLALIQRQRDGRQMQGPELGRDRIALALSAEEATIVSLRPALIDALMARFPRALLPMPVRALGRDANRDARRLFE